MFDGPFLVAQDSVISRSASSCGDSTNQSSSWGSSPSAGAAGASVCAAAKTWVAGAGACSSVASGAGVAAGSSVGSDSSMGTSPMRRVSPSSSDSSLLPAASASAIWPMPANIMVSERPAAGAASGWPVASDVGVAPPPTVPMMAGHAGAEADPNSASGANCSRKSRNSAASVALDSVRLAGSFCSARKMIFSKSLICATPRLSR